MIPKLSSLLLGAALMASLTGCKPKPPVAPGGPAAFRAKSHKEAVKAYTALVDKYPESEYSAQAQTRLSALGPAPAAAPAPKR